MTEAEQLSVMAIVTYLLLVVFLSFMRVTILWDDHIHKTEVNQTFEMNTVFKGTFGPEDFH